MKHTFLYEAIFHLPYHSTHIKNNYFQLPIYIYSRNLQKTDSTVISSAFHIELIWSKHLLKITESVTPLED